MQTLKVGVSFVGPNRENERIKDGVNVIGMLAFRCDRVEVAAESKVLV